MRRHRDPENRKKAILEATLELVRTIGMERTGLKEIAEKAGVSKSTILHHFKSKDDLFVQTGDYFFGQYREKLDSFRNEAKTDPVRSLSLYLGSLYQNLRSDSHSAVLLSQMLYANRVIPERGKSSLCSAYKDIMKPAIETIGSIIESGVTLGTFKPAVDIALLPFLVYALTRGISLAVLMPGLQVGLEKIGDNVRMQVFGLLGIDYETIPGEPA